MLGLDYIMRVIMVFAGGLQVTGKLEQSYSGQVFRYAADFCECGEKSP